MLRVGVIGVGHLGQYHVGKYLNIPEVKLVGVVDIDSKRARKVEERYGLKAYSDHREILDKVDAVSIAVPTEVHFEVAVDVLNAGVHALIEKPITYELERADSLIDLAQQKNLVLQVGLVERFNPAVVKMESFLERPMFIESHRMNLFTPRGTDVDVVLDLMIHDLDIVLHVISSPVKELHAVGMSVITGKTDIANARLIFENGTVANLTASRVSNEMLRKIRVFQPNAYISANCGKRRCTLVRLDNDVVQPGVHPQLTSQKMEFPDSDPLADEIASFVDVVRKGATPVVTGQHGRNALKIALEIIDQIQRGCKDFEVVSPS